MILLPRSDNACPITGKNPALPDESAASSRSGRLPYFPDPPASP